MKKVCVVAQEFVTPGNCGALARVMKNFGLTHLVFLDPKCDYMAKESLDRAAHAKDVLKKARVMAGFRSLAKKFDYLVGTTSILGTDYNLVRLPITPKQFAKMRIKNKVAIIIGREGEGMSNEELRQCDIIVHIPANRKYPTLNVSHAAAIVLYELFQQNKEKTGDNIIFANGKDKEALVKKIYEALERMIWKAHEKKETQKIVWKRVIGKSLITRREAFALFGFFKKIK